MYDTLAILVGATISLIMAAANVSYALNLASGDTLGVPNKYLLAALGIAMDVLLILCPFAFQQADRARRLTILTIFAIASSYSIHALNGFLQHQTSTKATQNTISQSYEQELKLRLQDLEKAKVRDYTQIEKIRQQLKPSAPMTLNGYELLLALSLWFVHSTVWFAFLTSSPTISNKETSDVRPTPATGKHLNGTQTRSPARVASNARPGELGRKPLI